MLQKPEFNKDEDIFITLQGTVETTWTETETEKDKILAYLKAKFVK